MVPKLLVFSIAIETKIWKIVRHCEILHPIIGGFDFYPIDVSKSM